MAQISISGALSSPSRFDIFRREPGFDAGLLAAGLYPPIPLWNGEIVWGFGDIALGLMAIPNLIAVILLTPKVREMTRDYFSREHTVYK